MTEPSPPPPSPPRPARPASPSGRPPGPGPDAPVVEHRRPHPSLVWLVPALAALIGLSMLVNAWLSAGPVITISFLTAAGLEAG